MNLRTRLALTVMLLATLASVANVGLALLDSTLARGRLFAVLCGVVAMAAGIIVSLGCLRALKVTHAVWRVDTAIPVHVAVPHLFRAARGVGRLPAHEIRAVEDEERSLFGGRSLAL